MTLLDLTDQTVQKTQCLVLWDQKDLTLRRLQRDPKDQTDQSDQTHRLDRERNFYLRVPKDQKDR
jgi:hypothetical protein